MKVRQQMLQPNAPTLIRCDVETTSLTVCGQRLVTLSDDASGKGDGTHGLPGVEGPEHKNTLASGLVFTRSECGEEVTDADVEQLVILVGHVERATFGVHQRPVA